MLTVREYMTHDPVTLRPEMSVHEARQILLGHDISGAPVLDERARLVGILTERDIIGAVFRASYFQEPGSRVADCMTAQVETLEADVRIEEAAERFLKSRLRRFPVVEENRVIGLISRRDVLRAIEDLWSRPESPSTPVRPS